MKFKPAVIVVAALAAAGCQSSHVMVGQQRAAIDPDQVRIYSSPPPDYEEVAMLTHNSGANFAFTAQQKTTAVVNGLKERAASLGANGVLITSLSNSSWRQSLGPMQEAEALAIWVPKQKPVTQQELDKSLVVQQCIDECRESTGKSAAALLSHL